VLVVILWRPIAIVFCFSEIFVVVKETCYACHLIKLWHKNKILDNRYAISFWVTLFMLYP